MTSFQIHNVKDEKAEAMRRYNNRQKKFKNLSFFVEIFAAFALLSWSLYTCIPVVKEMATEFLVPQNGALLSQSSLVLIAVNVLILIIFISSSFSSSSPPQAQSESFYNEYVSLRNVSAGEYSPAVSETVPPRNVSVPAEEEETPVVDKQIVLINNAVQKVEKLNFPTKKPTREFELSSPVSPVTELTNRYRRSQSERLERQKQQRKLRRSETTLVEFAHDSTAAAATRRWSSAMDDLSSEEFRLTIETFIASKKKTLIRENTLDFKLETNQCVAIALRS